MRITTSNKRRRNLWILIIGIALVILLASTLTTLFEEPHDVTTFVSTPQVGAFTVEYPTQSHETSPSGIAVDSAGDVWFGLENASSLAELIPQNGTIHEYHVPGLADGVMVTWGIAVDDVTSTVWFTEQSSNSIWSFNVTSHHFTQYKLKTFGAFPFAITIDSSQNIWFTELEGNKLGEISSSGDLVEMSIPVGGAPAPSGIAVAPNGTIWFTLPNANSIGSYADGTFHIDNLSRDIYLPVGISVDQKGNVWMTQHGASFITEFDPAKNYLMTFSTSNNSLPASLPYFCYVDSAGDLWINEHQGNAEAEYFPSNSTLVEYFIPSTVPAGNISYALTSGISPSGQPWYAELLTGKVGTVNLTKKVDVDLNLMNYSGPETISNYGTLNLPLAVNSGSTFTSLKAYVGNFTGNFTFTFTPQNGNGSFDSTLFLRTTGAAPGIYFITLTARTNAVAVSRIIEIKVI